MSGRKNVLPPYITDSAHSLAASFTSVPVEIPFLDNCAFQINVTTTNSVGSFAVQGSLDYSKGNALEKANTGNWINLTLGGGTPSVASQNDSILINLNEVPFKAIRLSYTSSVAGTGTCNIYVMAKMI